MLTIKNLIMISTTIILSTIGVKAKEQQTLAANKKQDDLSGQLKSNGLIKDISFDKGSVPSNCVGNLSD